jgi:hypothetical protein
VSIPFEGVGLVESQPFGRPSIPYEAFLLFRGDAIPEFRPQNLEILEVWENGDENLASLRH